MNEATKSSYGLIGYIEKVTEYDVLCAITINVLVVKIREALKSGWELYGDFKEFSGLYYQSVIKKS